MLSNFEYTAIYDCSNQVKETDSVANSRIKLYHFTELVDKFDEINNLIGRESVYTGHFDNEWSEMENKILRFSVDDYSSNKLMIGAYFFTNEFFADKNELPEEN